MVTLDTTDLTRLSENEKPNSPSPSAPPALLDLPKPAADKLVLSGHGKSESSDEKAVRKLAEKLPEPEKVHFADILKIVSENAPSVMKSFRAILANKSGIEPAPPPDLERLSKTLQAAKATAEPEARVADVVSTLGLVPEGQKDQFLKAAEALLNLEASSSYSSGGAVSVHPSTGTYEAKPQVFKAEVNFDLFYSVSARSSIKSGEDASGSFYEASYEVATKFEANFSLEISGRFLSLADAAEKVDPKVLDAFSEAVAGLAKSSDENALDRFFAAAEQLFEEVEEGYGLAEGAFDGVAEEMKATAESFFLSVKSANEEVLALPGADDLLGALGMLADHQDEALMKSLMAGENARGLRLGDMNNAAKLLNESDLAA